MSISKTQTLGASRFAAAIGISPWMSRAKLWREMTGRFTDTNPANWAMQHGLDHEMRAINAVSAISGVWFDSYQFRATIGRLHATLDALSTDDLIGCEVKCPKEPYDEIPDHYLPQIAGQIYLAGLHANLFACWMPDDVRIWQVSDHLPFCEWMFKLLNEFLIFIDDDTEPTRLKRKPIVPRDLLAIERIQ